MILFAIIGWGFCCLQWHIKKHHQSSDLDGVSDSSRTSTDTMTNGKRVHFHGYNPLYTNSPSSPLITSPISIKTANNGVIVDTYVIDCSIPKNRQEMASSLQMVPLSIPSILSGYCARSLVMCVKLNNKLSNCFGYHQSIVLLFNTIFI